MAYLSPGLVHEARITKFQDESPNYNQEKFQAKTEIFQLHQLQLQLLSKLVHHYPYAIVRGEVTNEL